MIPVTTRQPVLNPAPFPGEPSRVRVYESGSHDGTGPPNAHERRLRELDREWDVESLASAAAGAILVVSVPLVVHLVAAWAVLTVVVAGGLLFQALFRRTPVPFPLRRFGVRTTREIARERFALEAARADGLTLGRAGQDREDVSRFENEGGVLAEGDGGSAPEPAAAVETLTRAGRECGE